MQQAALFDYMNEQFNPKRYLPVLTVVKNRKGVVDVDTVKGCELGMRAYPTAGCYAECYALKIARAYGFDFKVSVSRKLVDREHMNTLTIIMQGYPATWYRIGTAGDPCHDWSGTLTTIRALRYSGKIPVIITKHWRKLSDDQIERLRRFSAVVNTSTSGMDSDAEIKSRVGEIERLKACGVRSVCRVVTANYGSSEWSRACREKQNYLLSLVPVIDTPLRCSKKNQRVMNGDIIVSKIDHAIGGGKNISLNSSSAYLGACGACPDQCGVDENMILNKKKETVQW